MVTKKKQTEFSKKQFLFHFKYKQKHYMSIGQSL